MCGPRIDIRLPTSNPACGTLAAATAKGRGFGIHEPGLNHTLDARVEALEKNVVAIHERVTQTQRELDAEFLKLTEAVKREKLFRQSEDQANQREVRSNGHRWRSHFGDRRPLAVRWSDAQHCGTGDRRLPQIARHERRCVHDEPNLVDFRLSAPGQWASNPFDFLAAMG